MAKQDENATGANNFHVRLGPRTAQWLRRRVDGQTPSVPAVIREILTKEEILEKERRRTKRARKRRKL